MWYMNAGCVFVSSAAAAVDLDVAGFASTFFDDMLNLFAHDVMTAQMWGSNSIV
jgi:hypothetical protein